jgi:hypothetical protein
MLQIVFQFAMASARGFNYCVDVRFIRPSGKLCEIRHSTFLLTNLVDAREPRRGNTVPHTRFIIPAILQLPSVTRAMIEIPSGSDGSGPAGTARTSREGDHIACGFDDGRHRRHAVGAARSPAAGPCGLR